MQNETFFDIRWKIPNSFYNCHINRRYGIMIWSGVKKQKMIITIQKLCVARQLELCSEKGVSCWLTSLPLKEYGFSMNKQEFHDAIALRYNFKISDMSGICGCNQKNSVNHSLICKKGGYVALRHNSLRDTCLLYTSPSPRDGLLSRMPSSA